MSLLVTGASGFLGRNFLRTLSRECEVTAVYHQSQDFQQFVESLDHPCIRPVQLDLANADASRRLAALGTAFDTCIFLAANSDPAVSVQKPALDLRWNALSVVQLVEQIRFKRFIYFSSGAVYDGLSGAVSPKVPVSPTLPYAISKLAAERYLHHFQRSGSIEELFIVRFFGAYGPFEPERKIYGRLVRQFAFEKNPRFTLRGDGRNLIDAMYVDDAIAAVHRLLEAPPPGAILDCASSQPITLKALVQKAAELFGLDAEISYQSVVPEYIEFFSVDDTLRKVYQFTPQIDLADGLRRFAEFLRREPSRPGPPLRTEDAD